MIRIFFPKPLPNKVDLLCPRLFALFHIQRSSDIGDTLLMIRQQLLRASTQLYVSGVRQALRGRWRNNTIAAFALHCPIPSQAASMVK